MAEEKERKHGKTGVMAKIAAIDAQKRENANAIKEIDASVKQLKGAINAQVRENDAYIDNFYYG